MSASRGENIRKAIHFKDGGIGGGGRVSSENSIQDLESSGRDKVAFYFTPPHWV